MLKLVILGMLYIALTVNEHEDRKAREAWQNAEI